MHISKMVNWQNRKSLRFLFSESFIWLMLYDLQNFSCELAIWYLQFYILIDISVILIIVKYYCVNFWNIIISTKSLMWSYCMKFYYILFHCHCTLSYINYIMDNLMKFYYLVGWVVAHYFLFICRSVLLLFLQYSQLFISFRVFLACKTHFLK